MHDADDFISDVLEYSIREERGDIECHVPVRTNLVMIITSVRTTRRDVCPNSRDVVPFNVYDTYKGIYCVFMSFGMRAMTLPMMV